MIVAIISFVAAASGSGKTTLIEKIVTILKSKGLRVAVIKHASAGYDLDKPGKDSWRFQQAGADTVLLFGPGKMAIMKKLHVDPSLDELERMAGDADVVIMEGYRKKGAHRIEVFRSGVSGDTPLCRDDPSYAALVSDTPFNVPVPRFELNDVEGIVKFIRERFVVPQ